MPVDDPIALFSEWFERVGRECAEPNAMVLSTVDADGRPSGRYVLRRTPARVSDRGLGVEAKRLARLAGIAR